MLDRSIGPGAGAVVAPRESNDYDFVLTGKLSIFEFIARNLAPCRIASISFIKYVLDFSCSLNNNNSIQEISGTIIHSVH